MKEEAGQRISVRINPRIDVGGLRVEDFDTSSIL